ncbi:MAG: ribosome biogenesis GTPase Der [Deltaproteobacteria bacterium]|nr:ribosome biogenesis GTPase Der [Deltaproteobacteria bacterium]
MNPVVAIVGRPNVGKSTLFNRIIRTRKAIVEDEPGVTRDRNYGEASWGDRSFTLIDTGGFEPVSRERLPAQIREQIQLAIEEADLIIFLMDGKEGLTPADEEIDRLLRAHHKPLIYTVNKIDSPQHEARVFDFYSLGVDRIFPVSASHGYGVEELLDEITRALPRGGPVVDEERIRVAVVGRPNVGKSSWINRVLGQERLLVDDRPGTTRDAIDTPFAIGPRKYLLIDTAGIRRKKKIGLRLEKYAVVEALKSIDRCDVALLLLDPFEKVTEQDARIGGFIQEKGRACVIAVNKWDQVKKDNTTVKTYTEEIRQGLKHLAYAPIVFISALTGQRVRKTLDLIDQVATAHQKRVGTSLLNTFVREAVERFPPRVHRGKRGKIYFVTQASTKPPTFVAFVNDPDAIHFSYERYLINQIRERFDFQGTPIRIYFRPRG